MKDDNEWLEFGIKASRHQPSKDEMECEYDMPWADIETLRMTFFRPVEIQISEVWDTLL